MLEKIRNAMKIVKACWKVLLLDKELLVFPLLTISVLGFLTSITIWPFWASGQMMALLNGLSDNPEQSNFIWILAINFAIYFVTVFVMVFFNAALIACVKIRFAGDDPTVMDGLRASTANLPKIFVWALFASVIGFALSQMKDKSSGILSFVFGALGVGWAVASYFVIPVLVTEKVGPIEAIKQSAKIIKKTWGEAAGAEIGLGVLNIAVAFSGVAIVMLGGFLFEAAPAVSFAIWGVGAIYIVLAALILTTLGSILKAALYVYAKEGKIPLNFDDKIITGAFKSA